MSSIAPDVARDAPRVAQGSDFGLARAKDAVVARLAVVTPLGWGVAGTGFAAWFVGSEFGWLEFEYAAAAALALLVIGVVFTIGRAELSIGVRIEPPRVVVGNPAAGEVVIRNISGRRLIPVPVELPIGAGAARFELPPLPGGGEYEDAFVVPTNRRAVIPVGPAKSVRSDPLGLFRREVVFSEMLELFVHPRTAPLDSLGSGFLRDLEGSTTEAISASDLAFHSLRPYAPGDDRRHIHWRTTARMPSGDLMVQQYLETRRSHLVIVVDAAADSYASEEEFELTISGAASIAVRAVRDELEVTVVPGRQELARGHGIRLLDAFSRLELSQKPTSLDRLSSYAARACGDASLVFLATGSRPTVGDLQLAAGRFDLETKALALVSHLGETASLQAGRSLRIMRMGTLEDLPRLARVAAQG